MRAAKHSPLLRIALLVLAVLSAHTSRAADVQRINAAGPPCQHKVAAALPDPEKKASCPRRIAPARPDANFRHAGHSFGFTLAHSARSLSAQSARQSTFSTAGASIPPHRSPLVLRI